MSDLKVTDESLYTSLFQNGRIGKLALSNRILMAAMGNALADDKGCVSGAMLDYYRTRAAGGLAMVVTQFAAVSREAVLPYNLALYDDSFLPAMRQLMQTIHDSGARACIQLMHPGMLFLLLKSFPQGTTIHTPSITPRMGRDKPYQILEIPEIEKITLDFADAAVRAREAGADAIEIHACHGCLLSTFMTPVVNQRTDEYGGSVENRTRFTRRVIEAVREKLGPEYPITVRINGADDVEGGVTPAEVVQQARILKDTSVDAISISSGLEYWSTLMAPSYLTPEGIIVPIAEEVRRSTGLPVIASGKISPELASQSIAEGKIDFVAFGRPLLADPRLPEKLRQGRVTELTRCLYCNNCLRTGWRSCTVNPFLYRESLSAPPAAATKKILVIGGGLAGMQAAVICAERGHAVTLLEKEPVLGGQWNAACAIPGKSGYAEAIKRLKYRLDTLKVEVKLQTVATRELVANLKPDAAVVATGAVHQDLDLPGTGINRVIQATDVIQGRVEATGRITIVGGSVMAMETAVLLAGQGKEVSLVSHSGLGGRKGPDDMITFRGLLRRLVNMRVPLYLNVTLIEIKPEFVVFSLGGEIINLPSDTVISAIGVRPLDTLAGELKGVVPEIYLAGDCIMPGTAAQATYSAAKTALRI